MKWVFAATLAGLLGVGACAAADELCNETTEFQGFKRSFHMFVPQSVQHEPLPLLVLLHGSYGDGRSIASKWLPHAKREKIILAAPDARDRRQWQIRADGPGFIHVLVAAVAARHPIDRRRIYLFGHSGGAVYALTLSMLESEFFAATAVHAGAWRTAAEFVAVPHARRKIPIAIFVGDRDEFFPVFTVRKTQSSLEQAGHAVKVSIIPRHAHGYDKIATEINRDAWDFLKVAHLAPALPGS